MENTNLERLKEMAYACRRCGYCREKYSNAQTRMTALRACPVREHTGGFEHHYARGKLQIAQGILEGRFSYSMDLIDVLYTDPDCGLCSWVCGAQPTLDPPKVWRAMREDIVAAGLGPPQPLAEIDTRVRTRHNVFGGRPELRSRWAGELGLPKRGEVLYFAGCHGSYVMPEIARAAVGTLRAGGIDPAYLGEDEWCCGVVQFHDGSVQLAAEAARHNVEIIRTSGARTVVTACAECYKSFKIDYPTFVGDLPFEVLHISELLQRLLEQGTIGFTRPLPESKVTYHDPCRLGRYCGVFDAPRDVIGGIPGIELAEMPRTREWAWCCGGGADLVSTMDTELGSAMARDRLDEAVATGAEALITACPRCLRSLRAAGDEPKMYDLAVAAALAMGIGR